MPAALLIIMLGISAYAQDASYAPEAESFKHEIKLDVFWSWESALKIGYEYWLDSRSAAVFTAFHDFSTKPEQQTQALLGYRLYFLKFRRMFWLFSESDLGYTNGFGYIYTDGDYARENSRYNSFTTGLSFGIKFIIPETNTGLEGILGVFRMYGKKEWELNPNYGISITRRL